MVDNEVAAMPPANAVSIPKVRTAIAQQRLCRLKKGNLVISILFLGANIKKSKQLGIEVGKTLCARLIFNAGCTSTQIIQVQFSTPGKYFLYHNLM
jgi:hypothetical protein